MSQRKNTTAFLKECMADALFGLLRNYPLGKLSVQKITDTAGVSRITWFRSFSSKQEALTYKILRLWERWIDSHGIVRNQSFTTQNASDFFHFNYEIQYIHTILYSANLQSVLYDAYYQIVQSQSGSDICDSYRNRFYTYGLLGLLDEWIHREYRETPEEMTQRFLSIIYNPYEQGILTDHCV